MLPPGDASVREALRGLGMTDASAKRALQAGKIFLADVPVADGARCTDDWPLEYRPNAPRLVVGRDPVLVYHDDCLAVVHKPSGWLSTPAVGRRREDDIVGWTRRLLGSAHAVHRLDEATSGLLLVALEPRTQADLRLQLAEHAVCRQYLALVRGRFPDRIITFDTIMVRDRGDGRRGSLAPCAMGAGKQAVTRVGLVERLGAHASLVEATLETGRTHQIRIHLAEANCPVLGDTLYAQAHRGRAARRLALHAWRLAFAHPRDGRPLAFVAPLADDLERLRRRLAGRSTTAPQVPLALPI